MVKSRRGLASSIRVLGKAVDDTRRRYLHNGAGMKVSRRKQSVGMALRNQNFF